MWHIWCFFFPKNISAKITSGVFLFIFRPILKHLLLQSNYPRCLVSGQVGALFRKTAAGRRSAIEGKPRRRCLLVLLVVLFDLLYNKIVFAFGCFWLFLVFQVYFFGFVDLPFACIVLLRNLCGHSCCIIVSEKNSFSLSATSNWQRKTSVCYAPLSAN